MSSPVEEMYRRVGTLAPNFGGFYVNNAGDPTVVLLDTTSSVLTATQAVMEQVFGPKFQNQFTGRVWRSAQGQFNYVDLANWRDTIAIHIGRLVPLITGVGLNQIANRVNVGLRDTTQRAQAETLITNLGVPLKGILFERSTVPRAGSTINDRTRGIPAGYQFATNHFLCTVGANASPSYNPPPATFWLLTAAHCPDPNKIPQAHIGVDAYQPNTADANLVAHEIASNTFDTSSPGCTSSDGVAGCVDADAALYAYYDPSFANFGYLAKMASAPASGFTRGTLQVAFPDSVQTIDQVEGYENSQAAAFNQAMYRLGITSGYTDGIVTNLCYTTVALNNVVYRCQVRVYGSLAEEGDSGGPVFYIYSGIPKLFGVFDLIFDDGYTYSPMSKIYPALGLDPNFTLFCGC